MLLEDLSLQRLLRDVVHRESDLLILSPVAVVMAVDTRFLLCRNHAPHQFHGRVILTTIALPLRLDGHVLQHLCVGFHLHIQSVWCTAAYADGLCGIANGCHRDLLSVMARYLEVA